MEQVISKLLKGKEANHMMPFLWLHGEDESTLRDYMRAIYEANIKAVCVESRPHPDFCGPAWWRDMDIILDEARKRDMKVWILDDSHFPTGYANGAMINEPDLLRRQSVTFCRHEVKAGETVLIDKSELNCAGAFTMTPLEQMIAGMYETPPVQETFSDDCLLGIFAIRKDNKKAVSLMDHIADNNFKWTASDDMDLVRIHLTRNRGPHRSYINMMNKASVKVLIDHVYEPHFEHYKDDFGKTIAGFFSDEPELGNGHLYEQNNIFGVSEDYDFPWSDELEDELKKSLGETWVEQLAALWLNDLDKNMTSNVRYVFMDAVSRLVSRDFSFQIGDWCRNHGVMYIGHVIEDNNQHARTGSSLGHYFRGLQGQDMAGIDDIGGQVLPQGEDAASQSIDGSVRDGEFYHYMLGKLAGSLAAIDPLKKGRAICEIFGAYGWSEGVRLEKFLLDHFLVRGINYFVPHAFSAKEFPDPDCPPHFYAHGHNPQYRHFGELMKYGNRVANLISEGHHIAPAAIAYHGEAEWMGETTKSHEAGRILADHQIDYDYLPEDVFSNREYYKTSIDKDGLHIGKQTYKMFLIPKMECISKAYAEGIKEMLENGVNVAFVDEAPERIGNFTQAPDEITAAFSRISIWEKEQLPNRIGELGIYDIALTPADNNIHYYHYVQPDNTSVYILNNEGQSAYHGKLLLTGLERFMIYDAWNNKLIGRAAETIIVEPLKMLILVELSDMELKSLGAVCSGAAIRKSSETRVDISKGWLRSTVKAVLYPQFENDKNVNLPDSLEKEEPVFSGFIRYEKAVRFETDYSRVILEIEDAAEAAEVFINGQSLGIQIAPPMRYEISGLIKKGTNQIVIEAATTLEREMSAIPTVTGMPPEPKSKSGITGSVRLLCNEKG